MNYPKKQFTVYKQKKTCILYICKQNLHVCDHTFILSYIWCTWLIYWEFSAISIMYFNINIIFHINQVFDLKKKFKITQKYFPIYFSLTLCWYWFCVQFNPMLEIKQKHRVLHGTALEGLRVGTPLNILHVSVLLTSRITLLKAVYPY